MDIYHVYIKSLGLVVLTMDYRNNSFNFQTKALVAAQLENAIEKELLDRLKKGTVNIL